MQIIVNDDQLSLSMKLGQPAKADTKLPRVLPLPNSWISNTNIKTNSIGNLFFAKQNYICKSQTSQTAVCTFSSTIKEKILAFE